MSSQAAKSSDLLAGRVEKSTTALQKSSTVTTRSNRSIGISRERICSISIISRIQPNESQPGTNAGLNSDENSNMDGSENTRQINSWTASVVSGMEPQRRSVRDRAINTFFPKCSDKLSAVAWSCSAG